MLHNDQDGAVPWTQGIEYFVALRRLGKEVYLFNYNGEDHGLRNRANMKDWTRRMAEYFGHHLKGEPAPKWMSDGVAFHERDAEKLPFAPSFVDAYVKPAPAAPAAVEPATTPAASEAATGVVDTVRPEAARAEGRRAGAARGEGRRGDRARTDTAPIPAKVVVGEPAPPFAAADEQGTQHALAGYQGRRLLLWFYPKANTPGCTAQGCGLRDEFAKLDAAGVAVLGVSVDDAVANARFRADHQLPFPLLCDTDRAVSLAYGAAAAADAPMARRIAVLVGPDGKVEKFWPRVEPRGFAAEVVAAVAPQ
jgi:peroxiredoxin Q/BCP